MDEFIYFFYQNGLYLLLAIGVIKIVLIFIYKGFDLAYLFENFLIVYTSPGIEPNEKRKKFRSIHNIATVLFYFVLILWLAITGVVKYAE